MRDRRRNSVAIGLLLAVGLVAGGVAFADDPAPPTWTGCLSVDTGMLYDVMLGEEPQAPCRSKDMIIRFGSGDVTAVLAGEGLLGGAYEGDATLAVDLGALDERYAGPVDWSELTGIPADLADGDQTGSPLAGVECNAGKWVVGFDAEGNAMCSDGEIAEPPPDPWVPEPWLDEWRTRATNSLYSMEWRPGAANPDTGALAATHLWLYVGVACEGEPYQQLEFGSYWGSSSATHSIYWSEGMAGTDLSWKAVLEGSGDPVASACSDPYTIPVPQPMELAASPGTLWQAESVKTSWVGSWPYDPDTVELRQVDRVDVWAGSVCEGAPVAEATLDWSGTNRWSYTAPWVEHAAGTELYARSVQGDFTSSCAGPVVWPPAPEPPATTPLITSVVGNAVHGEGWTDGTLEVFEGASCDGTQFLMETLSRDAAVGTFTLRFSPYYYSVPPVGPGDTVSARARIAVSTTDCTSYTIPLS